MPPLEFGNGPMALATRFRVVENGRRRRSSRVTLRATTRRSQRSGQDHRSSGDARQAASSGKGSGADQETTLPRPEEGALAYVRARIKDEWGLTMEGRRRERWNIEVTWDPQISLRGGRVWRAFDPDGPSGPLVHSARRPSAITPLGISAARPVAAGGTAAGFPRKCVRLSRIALEAPPALLRPETERRRALSTLLD